MYSDYITFSPHLFKGNIRFRYASASSKRIAAGVALCTSLPYDSL